MPKTVNWRACGGQKQSFLPPEKEVLWPAGDTWRWAARCTSGGNYARIGGNRPGDGKFGVGNKIVGGRGGPVGSNIGGAAPGLGIRGVRKRIGGAGRGGECG